MALACLRPEPAQSGQLPVRTLCLRLARLAVASLHTELVLYPKPGLVSTQDSGSHQDMNAASFMRSLFALRHFFKQIAQAGWQGAGFARLQALGMQAEQRMLRATGGVNTHRGAIFCLGLLCAAAARTMALHLHSAQPQLACCTRQLRQQLHQHWGQALQGHAAHAARAERSHGRQVARDYGCGGAREQAAQAFPAVFELALPRLQQGLARGLDVQRAQLDALFSLMADLDDSNILYRGGEQGSLMVRTLAAQYLARGGSAREDWYQQALLCHRHLVAQRLSPGGAADLLAGCWFVHRWQAEAAHWHSMQGSA